MLLVQATWHAAGPGGSWTLEMPHLHTLINYQAARRWIVQDADAGKATKNVYKTF